MIIIADIIGDQHGLDIETAIKLEYLNVTTEIMTWSNAIIRATTDSTVTAIVCSDTALVSRLTQIQALPLRVAVFYALGSNTYEELAQPNIFYRNLVTAGAGDSELKNNTGYGNGLSFWDLDLADTHSADESSYSNGRIAGKLSLIKDALDCTWWECIWRARKTADRTETNRPINTFWHKYNGFGKVNTTKAINYYGVIPPTTWYSEKIDFSLSTSIVLSLSNSLITATIDISNCDYVELYFNNVRFEITESLSTFEVNNINNYFKCRKYYQGYYGAWTSSSIKKPYIKQMVIK